jgi:lipopolysaccharide cholinephosphotransferase
MNDMILRQLQLTMLEILKVFDKFCREHDLKYSLYAGSLLGAVRHQGFIPWDDDLDVCMSRADYEQFLTLWQESPVEGYVLQNKENSKYFDQSFSKIRKDHTTFLQDEWQIGNHHTGIFLDIFPIDRIPDGKAEQARFKWNCMLYQLLTREFVPPRASFPVKAGSRIILACIPKRCRENVRRATLKKITGYNGQPALETVAIETMASLRKPFAPDMLDAYIDLPFEDGKFMCFAGWDDHLRRKFGDYMQLPPEEDRAWKHHPLIIDFEHNYEELKA